MIRYILGRMGQIIPVLVIVSLIVFAVMRILPGDPAMLMLQGAEGGVITPERLELLREKMGLNDPVIVQYFDFLLSALVGDLGESIRFREPVMEMILERLAPTVQLALAGLLCSLIVGVPLGMLAAMRRGGWFDAFTMTFSYLGASTPVFFLGLILIFFFAFGLGWFPSAGATGFRALVMPAVTLGLINAGLIARLMRSSMLEVLGEDYMRTGRAKGLPPLLLLVRHGLKNAMIPVVTILGLQFGNMLAGTVVTETVFSRPGVGRMIVTAILSKDYPLIQGAVLFLSAMYVMASLAVDILYAWLDPRIRYDR